MKDIIHFNEHPWYISGSGSYFSNLQEIDNAINSTFHVLGEYTSLGEKIYESKDKVKLKSYFDEYKHYLEFTLSLSNTIIGYRFNLGNLSRVSSQGDIFRVQLLTQTIELLNSLITNLRNDLNYIQNRIEAIDFREQNIETIKLAEKGNILAEEGNFYTKMGNTLTSSTFWVDLISQAITLAISVGLVLAIY